jgi:hypothetical protein
MRRRSTATWILPSRRGLLVLAMVSACVAFAVAAWAGSYLDRAALLVAQATEEADYLRARLHDRELALTVHRLAAARLRAASRMQVPKEVTQAHPHLLLMLENYEQAASAAKSGDAQRFLEYLGRARDEEAVLRAVLKQLGWPLPRL